MRFAAALAVAAAAAAATVSAAATGGGLAVEAHPLSRAGAGWLGWERYGPLSILALALGLRVLARLPRSTWGIRVVAAAKLADAARDVWLVGSQVPALAGVPWPAPRTTAAILLATGVSFYLVTRPPPRPGHRRRFQRSV